MKTASITEARNKLSALIHGLRSGPVLILDRGRPVARLEAAEAVDDPQLAELIRDGIVTPPRRRLPKGFLTRPLPRLKDGISIVDILLEERREGR